MPFTKLQALEWALQVASGMTFLHSRGFMHRDMKPQNILLNKSNDALVADLGTVRLVASELRKEAIGEEKRQAQLAEWLELVSAEEGMMNRTFNMTGRIGTPAYMAPEQSVKPDYGNAVDIWAFGCTMVRLFTLRDPYGTYYNASGIITSVSMGQRRPIKVKRRDVPHVLVLTLINDCLQFDYKKRPSFKEIEERLKSALDACNGDKVSSKSGEKKNKEMKTDVTHLTARDGTMFTLPGGGAETSKDEEDDIFSMASPWGKKT